MIATLETITADMEEQLSQYEGGDFSAEEILRNFNALVADLRLLVDTDRPKVLTRFYKGLNDTPSTSTMSVQDLMDENAGYEDSAWVYLRDVVTDGSYDDSDWGSEVFCYYMATDGVEPVRAEAMAWWEANRTEENEDLESPAEWGA